MPWWIPDERASAVGVPHQMEGTEETRDISGIQPRSLRYMASVRAARTLAIPVGTTDEETDARFAIVRTWGGAAPLHEKENTNPRGPISRSATTKDGATVG